MLSIAGLAGCGGNSSILNAHPAPKPTSAPATPPSAAYLSPDGVDVFSGSIAATSNVGVVAALSQTQIAASSTAPTLPTDMINLKLGSSATATSVQRTPRSTSLAALLNRTSKPDTLKRSLRLPDAAVDDGQIFQRVMQYRRQHAGSVRTAAAGIARPQSLPTSQGSSSPIWVQVSALGSSTSTWAQVQATLALATTHGYIWIDNTLALNSASITAIGADFENAYASDTLHFGTPEYTATGQAASLVDACDATGAIIGTTTQIIPPPNGHHHVVVINPNNLGAGSGGYFTIFNHLPQAELNCVSPGSHSNEASMIFVGYDASNGDAVEINEDLVRGTAHELQHLINFVSHVVRANAGVDPSLEDRWLNEGLSMLAQDFAVTRKFPAVPFDIADALVDAKIFLDNAETHSLTGFTGLAPGNSQFVYNCQGCYGLSYLFMRYNFDRFGGDAFLSKMENQAGLTGLPELQAATNVAAATNISDFGMALLATGFVTTSDPRFTFSRFNPLGTYIDQFGNSLTLQGVSVFLQDPGTSHSYALYNGTFSYFVVPKSGTSTAVTISDVGGLLNLNAGLVQK
jgi:hypothetical protein